MADRYFLTGHVPRGLWPAQCRVHGVPVWRAESAGRQGVMGSDVRHRLLDGISLISDEQYADGAVCHSGRAGVAALCHFVMRY